MALQMIDLPSGTRIALDDSGGAGAPIIFSHGYMMDRNMFAAQVAHFSPEWRCITWDERAHGETESTGPFDYWDSARDLLGWMDALGIDKAVHVGMSQGGLVGMRAALLQPERFYGLVQLSTQAGPLPADDGDTTFPDTMDDWVANGADQAKLEFLSSFILGAGVDPGYWHDRWSRMTGDQIKYATNALYTIDALWDRLPELALPIATIHGLADIATSHELGLMTPVAVADPRGVSLIPGGPHAVNISHPVRVNFAIQAFLDELAAENPDMKG